ncbi:NADH-quinone oxidoreductase subunit NuoN [Salinisphaera orenii]|uniref:NADH-quinone oxidoreductase subunit NuoN n=1 Tax=Salinisphaera orenii TaxID=856731 RepID=UPI000DBE7695
MSSFSMQIVALLAPLIVTATIILTTGAVAITRSHRVMAGLSIIGLAVALISLIPARLAVPIQTTPLYIVDGFGLFYMALVLFAALVSTILAYVYLEAQSEYRAEFYILLLCSTLGALSLVVSVHLASLFIGIELLSIPLYGMVAYAFRDSVSLESGLKYMVLSGVASAFFLFGMALMYAGSGALTFTQIASSGNGGELLLLGIGMLVVGLAFKLSVAPFHLWTPDVYQGAPGPASAFLATVSKVAIFAALLRFFETSPVAHNDWLHALIAALAFISMLVGNLLALRQDNLKRILGYSSIAHLGYILTAIVAGGPLAATAVGVYFTAYVLTSLGAFGVVSLVSSTRTGTDASDLTHYRGLYRHQPTLAVTLAIMMISLAGIPVTFGFIGKFYALMVAVTGDLWWLVAALIIGSAIGLYYYLRVTFILFGAAEGGTQRHLTGPASRAAIIILGLLAALVIALGIYPTPLIDLVNATGIAVAA